MLSLLKSLHHFLAPKLVPACDITVTLLSGLLSTFSVCDDKEVPYLKLVCQLLSRYLVEVFLYATFDTVI